MKVLLIILIIAAAIFVGIRLYKSNVSSPGGSNGGGPILINPVSSFPNPYSS